MAWNLVSRPVPPASQCPDCQVYTILGVVYHQAACPHFLRVCQDCGGRFRTLGTCQLCPECQPKDPR